MKPIRIALADEYPVVRAGLKDFLSREVDIILVGEAANANETQKVCFEKQPDILLCAINLIEPRLGKKCVNLQNPAREIKKLVMINHGKELYLNQVITLGARGCILLDEPYETFIRAIRTIQEGDIWFSFRLIQLQLNSKDVPPVSIGKNTIPELGEREMEILYLLAQGLSNEEIAEKIYLSTRTVRHYVEKIFEKLKVSNRTKAVVLAMEQGLIN